MENFNKIEVIGYPYYSYKTRSENNFWEVMVGNSLKTKIKLLTDEFNILGEFLYKNQDEFGKALLEFDNEGEMATITIYSCNFKRAIRDSITYMWVESSKDLYEMFNYEVDKLLFKLNTKEQNEIRGY
jgi:hypothetical protein